MLYHILLILKLNDLGNLSSSFALAYHLRTTTMWRYGLPWNPLFPLFFLSLVSSKRHSAKKLVIILAFMGGTLLSSPSSVDSIHFEFNIYLIKLIIENFTSILHLEQNSKITNSLPGPRRSYMFSSLLPTLHTSPNLLSPLITVFSPLSGLLAPRQTQQAHSYQVEMISGRWSFSYV